MRVRERMELIRDKFIDDILKNVVEYPKEEKQFLLLS